MVCSAWAVASWGAWLFWGLSDAPERVLCDLSAARKESDRASVLARVSFESIEETENYGRVPVKRGDWKARDVAMYPSAALQP
jgi:hypothetical protein